MTIARDRPPQALSASTRRTYAADWALFADWCAAADQVALPADPATVVKFLAGCPAARKTQRGRVTAIDHHHTATGYAPPGQSPEVLAALGRPVPGPYVPAPDAVAAVDAALRILPVHGWTKGIFGRRDRCLLVLSQLAGVPYIHLAALTVGDISITDGTADINTPARHWTLAPDDDAVLCGPCAVVRWLRVLDLATTGSTSSVAAALGDLEPLTPDAPHLCRSTRGVDPKTLPVPVLTPINQWGALPFAEPVTLTPHGQSLLARGILAGDIGAHRDLPFPSDDPPPQTATPTPAPPTPTYTRAAAARAWTKRRTDLHHLADVGDVLSDVDQRIAELQDRVNQLLEGETT